MMPKGLAPDWLITDPLYLAIRLAASAHHNQLDKGGDPYLWHVLRVGISLLPDLDAAIVGVLHDVLEDSPGCAPAARHLLAPPQFEALQTLTRRSEESYDAYVDRVAAGGPLAIKVKLADLADNLRPDRQAKAQSRGIDVSRLVERYTRARDRLVSRPADASAPMVSGYIAEVPQERKPIDDATLWGGPEDANGPAIGPERNNGQ